MMTAVGCLAAGVGHRRGIVTKSQAQAWLAREGATDDLSRDPIADEAQKAGRPHLILGEFA